MPKLRSILPALAFAISAAILHAPANAQLTPLQDPANLAGERVSPQDPADTLPLNHGAPALQQLLAKLRTRASLMLIVAHPDDEDGGLLTFESRGQGARVAMLTLTRGEGGQNLMSADFDDALGLIRTQELLAADRYFGVDQFFGTEVDFGFSKTKEESFQKWTHDRVLYDAVRAVRLYRPLVIASVFVGGPTDGHGQHQVAGEIAQEVFLAAADPTVFPDMIAQGLLPWAPLKVYARVPFSRVTPDGMFDYATGRTIPTRFHNYVTGEDSTAVPTATVMIHEGDKPTDPTLAAAMGGDTFLQFARKGLALQKTQIGPNARLAPAGAYDAGYTLIASRTAVEGQGFSPAITSSKRGGALAPAITEQSLFDGIDTTLPGITTLVPAAPATLHTSLQAIDKQIAEAQRLFDPAHLEHTAPPLREALRTLDTLLATAETSSFETTQKQSLLHELRIKRVQLNNALVLALKIETDATGPSAHPFSIDVPREFLNNERTAVCLGIKSSTSLPLTLEKARLQNDLVTMDGSGNKTSFPLQFLPQEFLKFCARVGFPPSEIGTRPYFSRVDLQQPYYSVSNRALRNAPATPAPVIATFIIGYDGVSIDVVTDVLSGRRDPIPRPAVVVPPAGVQLSPSTGIVPPSSRIFTLKVEVRPNIPKSVRLELPSEWTAEPIETNPALENRSPDQSSISFRVHAPLSTIGQSYLVTAVVELNGKQQREGYRPVGYPGLLYTNFYTPATYRATAVDLHTAPNLRVAYLPGTGDTVPDFLPNLGITPTLLTLKELNSATLNEYDAILLGVRAYAAHPELAGPGSQPLLDYAKQGGVVILQYNTARYGDAEAPFPISVPGDSAHNVVEEAQPVTLLHPDAPLLTWPNKITAADFDGWVAERGHGFAASWSPQYQPLLETHDVGQDPQQGGLLLARTGKGAYIYCALALYRQLPEGVPGAYRLLANLLSLAKNPGFQAH